MDLLAGFVVMVFFAVMFLAPLAVVGLVAWSIARRRQQAAMPPAQVRALGPADHARISELLTRGQKIEAVKVVRDVTGVPLTEAKSRVDHWWDAPSFPAAIPSQPAPIPGALTVAADERLRIEAAAIVATSGWHTAEAFLREQRGLTPEAAKALLDALP